MCHAISGTVKLQKQRKKKADTSNLEVDILSHIGRLYARQFNMYPSISMILNCAIGVMDTLLSQLPADSDTTTEWATVVIQHATNELSKYFVWY